MDNMMAALPPGHASCPLFQAAFLNWLPTNLADLVAVQFEQLEAKELAKYAGRPQRQEDSRGGRRPATQEATEAE